MKTGSDNNGRSQWRRRVLRPFGQIQNKKNMSAKGEACVCFDNNSDLSQNVSFEGKGNIGYL